ncbi:MAG: PTS sugar transporter subunit IIB [Halanaerobium sp.]|nr:PTS sugar transporter subunit IIB [Halanaerobium sp.]
MAVIHMRIDNRLIHGQVTASWVSHIGADHIIVTNDKVSKDPIQKQLLPQAARGVKTSVLSVDDTVDYVKSEEAQKEKIMIVAKFPSDALELVEKGVEPEEINVGNQAPLPNKKCFPVTNQIMVAEGQADIYRKIADKGYNLTVKLMPSDSPGDFIKKLDSKGL